MPEQQRRIVRSINTRLTVLTVAVVILCVVVGGFSAYTFVTLRQVQNAACSLRADEATRIAEGHKFLREHPDGIADISGSVLRVSIQNQEKTVKALSGLPCQ